VRGRGYVVLLFVLLCGYHVWAYLITQDYAKRAYVAHEIPWFCITTALFSGIFCRQNWARYILIALQLFRLGATLIFLPYYIEQMMQSFDLLVTMLSGPLVNAVTIWSLISIPSIRRLVIRNYE
jgi:hypothetical protein